MTRVSDELTEVRTVLSRAESALATLHSRPEAVRRYSTIYRAGLDPDYDEMIADLEVVVERLAKWARLNKNGTRKASSRR